MLKMTESADELALPRFTTTAASTRFSELFGAGTITESSLAVAVTTSAGSSPNDTRLPLGDGSKPRPFTTTRSPGTPARGVISETSGSRPRNRSTGRERRLPAWTTTGTGCPSTTIGSLGTTMRTRVGVLSTGLASTPPTVIVTPAPERFAPFRTSSRPGSAASGSSDAMRGAPGGPSSAAVAAGPLTGASASGRRRNQRIPPTTNANTSTPPRSSDRPGPPPPAGFFARAGLAGGFLPRRRSGASAGGASASSAGRSLRTAAIDGSSGA